MVADHHVAIDGMQGKDSSDVNDLSKFSYKGRVKGTRDISVLYAYDIEKMESVCAEVFPVGSIDASSYRSFIVDNDIRKGLIVDDKGFPVKMIRKDLSDRPDLHYLTPIKRNDARIADHDALRFDGVLAGAGEDILYSKRTIKNGTWLYAFRKVSTASREEHCFVERSAKKNFNVDKYLKKKDSFGTIVFESDEDMPPLTAYRSYSDRWPLELVFDRYKNDECLDHTNVQNDFSVIVSEFINFIATAATRRILNKARDAKVLEDEAYGDMMEDLSEAWRKLTDQSGYLLMTDTGFTRQRPAFSSWRHLACQSPFRSLPRGSTGGRRKMPLRADHGLIEPISGGHYINIW